MLDVLLCWAGTSYRYVCTSCPTPQVHVKQTRLSSYPPLALYLPKIRRLLSARRVGALHLQCTRIWCSAHASGALPPCHFTSSCFPPFAWQGGREHVARPGGRGEVHFPGRGQSPDGHPHQLAVLEQGARSK